MMVPRGVAIEPARDNLGQKLSSKLCSSYQANHTLWMLVLTE